MSQNSDTTNAGAARTKSKHIIVDIGARKKGQIRELRKGEGALMEEVEDCLHDLRANGRIDSAAQPVILVVRQKAKRNRLCPLCVISGKDR